MLAEQTLAGNFVPKYASKPSFTQIIAYLDSKSNCLLPLSKILANGHIQLTASVFLKSWHKSKTASVVHPSRCLTPTPSFVS